MNPSHSTPSSPPRMEPSQPSPVDSAGPSSPIEHSHGEIFEEIDRVEPIQPPSKRLRSSESMNPRHHGSTPSSPTITEPCHSSPAGSVHLDALNLIREMYEETDSDEQIRSGKRFKSSKSMNPSHHHGSAPSSPPSTMESSQLSPSDTAHPSSPMDAIESIRDMYKKIDPEKQIDPLIIFVENQLQKMNTPSEVGSSYSDGWLEIVGDGTKLGAKTIDIIFREVGKISKSEDAVKEMESLTLKVIEAVGELQWVFIGLSVAAFAVESYTSVGSTEIECRDLLMRILELAKYVTQYSKRIPDERGKLCIAVGTIVEGAVICWDYLRGKYFRFWSATTAAAQLEKTNIQLWNVRNSLQMLDLQVAIEEQELEMKALLHMEGAQSVRITKQSTMTLGQASLQLLDFEPVGIEKQVADVKGLLDMEGARLALAVIVCGFGGVGKSTLAASVVQSLNWSSTDFKFCKVVIDDKIPDKTSHIIKLQKDIIHDLGEVKLDLRDPEEGRRRIKEALKNKCALFFIDNVVHKDYIKDLLPIDLSSGEPNTKLRILITSREKSLKPELKMICKEYVVSGLSEAASKRLLFETIFLPSEMVEDIGFDEKSMINEVAVACRGVPLLLSVFGKQLRIERGKESYQEVLDVLRTETLYSYNEDLGTKLMFVYHKIKDVEVKEAFLDICTYFHGWEWNLVADIVDFLKLEDLRRRMFVSKSHSGEVLVHDILRLMGMKEARLTRFSNYKDLSDALEYDLDGFDEEVKGISLVNDNRLITIQSKQLEAMHQSLRVLMLGDWVTMDGPPCEAAFINLRYLHVGDITVFPFKDPLKLDKLRVFLNRSKPGMNLSHLSPNLRRISHEVPLVECDKFANLPFQNLSSLNSFIVKTQKSVELPKELLLPASLVDLGLNRCKNLPKDIGHLTALESLILDGSGMTFLPEGFGKLKKLKHLSLDYCSKLESLPEEIGTLSSLEALSMKDCRSLRALPESLGGLLSLQKLELSGSINLQLLPESFGELRMHKFTLFGLLKLQKLPSSFGNMALLKYLILESCRSLKLLPDSFLQLKMLETLKISYCTKLSILPEEFGQLRYLKHMTLEDCHLIKELPHGFGALPALKTFTLKRCNRIVNLPRDFTELTSLEELCLVSLPLKRIPDGFGKLQSLRFLCLVDCFQLKTLSDDFQNIVTLEQLTIQNCPEMEGAMMEKIVKLQNCSLADIHGSRNLLEKWKHMQSEIEHSIAVFGGLQQEDQENRDRAIRVALLHGKCVEMNNITDQLMERPSLLVGLEKSTRATVALVMLPIQMQLHQHQTLQRFVEMAKERAKTNGSGKLQIVCARKYVWRSTATEEDERAEEGGIRQILLSLPKGSCALSKRVKILRQYRDPFDHGDEFNFFIGHVLVDLEGRKRFENFEIVEEDEISENVVMDEDVSQTNQQSLSICDEDVAGQSKMTKFIETSKGLVEGQQLTFHPGLRFHPTDEELLDYYLRSRLENKHSHFRIFIQDLDLYSHEPWDLPGLAAVGGPEWYFFVSFSSRLLKRGHNNRSTPMGYWKPTGKDRDVCNVRVLGRKKILVFYTGRVPRGERTQWVMHEYRFDHEEDKEKEDIRVCRVFKNTYLGETGAGNPVVKEENISVKTTNTNTMNRSNLTSAASDEASISCSAPLVAAVRPGTPDPDVEVIALSPKTLMATNRFVCEICNKGFQRDQNLQLHRRGHNLPWKLRQRTTKEIRKRVYICPEPSCVHHEPSRALGDLTGIKKHFCRKHGEKKWKCDKCSKRYALQSDWKAHSKFCGTREFRCDCGTLFSRRDSFITHRVFCDALAEESARLTVNATGGAGESATRTNSSSSDDHNNSRPSSGCPASASASTVDSPAIDVKTSPSSSAAPAPPASSIVRLYFERLNNEGPR